MCKGLKLFYFMSNLFSFSARLSCLLINLLNLKTEKMKKSIIKPIAILFAILFFANTLKAQMVAVPDVNFRNKLMSLGFSSCFNATLDSINSSNALVQNATNLNLSSGGNPPYITNLAGLQAFTNLTTLDVSWNNISSFSWLPANLNSLVCIGNQITTLPSLPASLTILNCGSNLLTTLPTLPSGLQLLACENNSLSSLPTILPNTLWALQCSHNQISTLPILPNSLITFTIDHNPITSLPASLPLGLQSLSCGNTNISSIPVLPNSMSYFNCDNTNITALPLLPDSLNNISCVNCPVTTIPSLVPSKCASFNILGTYITCLTQKAFSMVNYQTTFKLDTNFVKCTPYPYYLFTDSASLISYNLPICGNNNITACPILWSIAGNVFEDNNMNCQQDISEMDLMNIKVELLDKNGALLQQTYTLNNGEYFFKVNSFDTFYVRADTANYNFMYSCPAFQSIQVINTPLDSIHPNVNFGLMCNGNYNDKIAYGTAKISGIFFPGQTVVISPLISQSLYCSSNTSGKVKLYKTGDASFSSILPTSLNPSILTADSVIWNISSFNSLNFFNDFKTKINVNTTAQSGNSICFTLVVETNTPDIMPNNNTNYSCYSIVNSLDPNDKDVQPSGNILPTNEWLTYTIRFQNTGTAQAFNIVVLDTIDSNLQLPTFELLSYSHQPTVSINENSRLVKFAFANINLPDSNSNEPESHGYVTFRIKQNQNLPMGNVIQNTASIYFDYNPAVVTNTTKSTIGFPSSISTPKDNSVCIIYPNPSRDKINLSFDATLFESGNVRITDIIGREIDVLKISKTSLATFDISKYDAGVYFITLEDIKGNRFTYKFVKNNL